MDQIVLAGLGRAGRPYLTAAREAGLGAVVLDNPVSLGSTRTRMMMDAQVRSVPVIGNDVSSWYTALSAACDETTIAVVPFSEPQVLPVAIIAEHMGLKAVGVTAALISQNKAMQRSRLATAGVLQPKHFLITSISNTAILEALPYPLIAKPVDRAGSEGVQMVADLSELNDWHSENIVKSAFLVEQYIDKPEYSVECIFDDGILQSMCVTEKLTTGVPHFVEVAHIAPATLGEKEEQYIRITAQAVITAVGADTGMMHLEVRGSREEWFVIEFALRTPGDHILELHKIATGTDLFSQLISALSEEFQPRVSPEAAGYAMTWFVPINPGTVVQIEGIDAVEQIPGVRSLRVDATVGDTIGPLRSSADRPVTLILSGESRDSLFALQAEVLRKLTFKTSCEEGENGV